MGSTNTSCTLDVCWTYRISITSSLEEVNVKMNKKKPDMKKVLELHRENQACWHRIHETHREMMHIFHMEKLDCGVRRPNGICDYYIDTTDISRCEFNLCPYIQQKNLE